MTVGTLRFTKEFTTILDPVLDGDGLLILGQEQDTFGGGFDKFQSFSGKISQFNMFQRWVERKYAYFLVILILIKHLSNSFLVLVILDARTHCLPRNVTDYFRQTGVLDRCNCSVDR